MAANIDTPDNITISSYDLSHNGGQSSDDWTVVMIWASQMDHDTFTTLNKSKVEDLIPRPMTETYVYRGERKTLPSVLINKSLFGRVILSQFWFG